MFILNGDGFIHRVQKGRVTSSPNGRSRRRRSIDAQVIEELHAFSCIEQRNGLVLCGLLVIGSIGERRYRRLFLLRLILLLYSISIRVGEASFQSSKLKGGRQSQTERLLMRRSIIVLSILRLVLVLVLSQQALVVLRLRVSCFICICSSIVAASELCRQEGIHGGSRHASQVIVFE